MKEIIYIQAGNISNHIGTHFWNTQETYFTYDDDFEPLVDHDISFREGISDQNEPTFCPRALIFDHKSNFGPMGKFNDLYPEVRDAEEPFQRGIWNGAVSEHRHEAISKSEYQQRLDSREDEAEDYFEDNRTSKMRFWSDFNRIHYIPRSIQKVPDLPDWQANKGDWNHGKSVFTKYDIDNGLNEESLRQFLEETNHSQGFQMTFDNSSFGGFCIGLLETIRDELPKIPVLAFPILSGIDPSRLDVEEPAPRKLVLQDAACICALDEFATQNIAFQTPKSWRLGKWSEELILDKSNLYQSSAVLSTHIESTTLPLRLKGTTEELSDFCTQLNWSQNTRFSHLSGVLTFRDVDNIEEFECDFSVAVEPFLKSKRAYWQCLAQRSVSRGLRMDQARRVDELFTSRTGLHAPYLTSVHAPPYPLPSSFPNIFRPGAVATSQKPIRKSASNSISTSESDKAIPLLSTLRTTTATSDVLQDYSTLMKACVARRYRGPDAAGLEMDEMRDMVEKLAGMADGYAAQVTEREEEGDDVLEDGGLE